MEKEIPHVSKVIKYISIRPYVRFQKYSLVNFFEFFLKNNFRDL
jgi:hypothetical protein